MSKWVAMAMCPDDIVVLTPQHDSNLIINVHNYPFLMTGATCLRTQVRMIRSYPVKTFTMHPPHRFVSDISCSSSSHHWITSFPEGPVDLTCHTDDSLQMRFLKMKHLLFRPALICNTVSLICSHQMD